MIKQDGTETDDGYMHSEGTGEYSQILYPYPVKVYGTFLILYEVPIRGRRPAEVENIWREGAGESREGGSRGQVNGMS